MDETAAPRAGPDRVGHRGRRFQHRRGDRGTSWGTGGVFGFFVFQLPFLAFPVEGLLVATRRPGNKIG
jgi:hypothetical protein